MGAVVGLAIGLMAFFVAFLALGTIHAAGEAPVENFEWLPELNVTDIVNDQYPRALMKDLKTGELTLVYNRYEISNEQHKDIECDVVAVLNRTTAQWEQLREMNNTKVHSYFAYDHHLYMIHHWWETKTLRISVDDPGVIRLVDYDLPQYVYDAKFEVLEMDDEELVLLGMIMNGTTGIHHSRLWAQIITIDLDTYTSTTRTLVQGFKQYDRSFEYDYRDGRLDILWQWSDGTDLRIHRLRHQMDSDTTTGPELMDKVYFEKLYHPADFYWSPDGSVHVLFPDQGPSLRRYSADGELQGEFNMTGIIPASTVSYYSMMPLMVNGSNNLYIAHYTRLSTNIRTMIISPDYSGYIINEALDGDFEAWTLKGIVDDDDHVVLVYNKAVGDTARLRSVMQVPATPDLEVDPSTFVFVDDHEHGREHIAFSVRNVGKSLAEGYYVTVRCFPSDGDGMISVGSEEVDTPLRKQASRAHTFDTELPGGPLLVQVTISRTLPAELWTHNNVFEIWINVKNKAPELVVLWPQDGQDADGTLRFQGSTNDIEDPDGVITQISIPGDPYFHEITGSGDWEFTKDMSGVPSGRYRLLFQAYDGVVTTELWRTVIVDHPEETLTVSSFSPDGDVNLIVGEGQAFAFEADDMLYRPIAYTWTLDGVMMSEGTTSFAYIATVAGEFTLRVEADNTRHTVSHEWTVAVRDPIPPTVSPVAPVGDLEVQKGEEVEFLVTVDNPDGRTYTVQWTLDGLATGEGKPMSRTLAFPTSGEHRVRATLVAAEGVSHTEWTVAVVNRAPVIVRATPETMDIDITESVEMTFRVTAEDPDGDDLTYAWSASGLEVPGLAGPEGIIDLSCYDDEPYVVTVTVTDGEDEATRAWTVIPDPPEPQVNHPPVLVSARPSDDPVVIHEATAIEWTVEVSDEDGDLLTYVWGSSLLTMDDRNASTYSVDCPCDEAGQYTIWVTVSDGEHEVTAQWTVISAPVEEAPEMQNGHLPWAAIVAVILVACAGAIVYIYWKRTQDGR